MLLRCDAGQSGVAASHTLWQTRNSAHISARRRTTPSSRRWPRLRRRWWSLNARLAKKGAYVGLVHVCQIACTMHACSHCEGCAEAHGRLCGTSCADTTTNLKSDEHNRRLRSQSAIMIACRLGASEAAGKRQRISKARSTARVASARDAMTSQRTLKPLTHVARHRRRSDHACGLCARIALQRSTGVDNLNLRTCWPAGTGLLCVGAHAGSCCA
jgi:hypothetical protein